MRSAIDSAGRLVIPKPIRDAMGLAPGAPIDVQFVDGRIEIEFEPSAIRADVSGALPVLVSDEALPPLTDDAIRRTLDAVRR
ncbi:MAG TPA: AbrB/MazE/SpoVT family DNA-binding domain-containing protein [Microbacterium sp.]|nr:AbrB/MazE/SpoVT family DNA-binding domain-containing protein [Microbacterium sp.]